MFKGIMKSISILLVALFLLTALLSCRKNDVVETPDDSDVDVVESGSEGEDGIRYDANGYQMDNLPDNLNFDGKEIRIFAGSCTYNEYNIAADQINASVLNNAVYRRNLKTEARTGTRLKFIMEDASLGLDFSNQLRTLQSSAADAVQLTACYSPRASEIMMQGYTADLTKMNYLDFSAPWWSQELVEKASIYNHLYFASGDISPSLLGQTFIIYYNRDLAETYIDLEDYDAESLYDMVYDKTWTLDNFIKMCKGVGFDANSDNKKDDGDTYGFTVHCVNQDGFFQAAGLNAIAYNEDGSAKVSDDMSSAKAATLVQKLVDFYNSPDAMCNEQYSDGTQEVPLNAWENGNAMFFGAIVSSATRFQQKGIDFGILPLPKWDVEQERYYSISGFPYLLWSITRAATGDDMDAAAAVMECLASESHRTVAPALFTTVLQEQASNSSADYEMWNTIKSSISIEGGRCFNSCLQSLGWSIFREAIMKRTGDYMSFYAGKADQLNGYVASMNTIIASIEEVYGD